MCKFDERKRRYLSKRYLIFQRRNGIIIMTADCGQAALFASRRRLIEEGRSTELFESDRPFTIIYTDPEAVCGIEDPSSCVVVTPALGGSFVTVPGEGRTLHIVDSGCRQGFFTLEE